MFDEKAKDCEGCDAQCCKYIAMEIDAPESLEDLEDIKWYVCHKNVHVYVDEDHEWHVEFITPCEHLGEDFKCGIYDKRPDICKDYDHEECTFHNPDYIELFTFKHVEDVEKYIEDVFNKGEHVIPDDEEEEDDEDDSDEEEEGEGLVPQK